MFYSKSNKQSPSKNIFAPASKNETMRTFDKRESKNTLTEPEIMAKHKRKSSQMDNYNTNMDIGLSPDYT